VLWVLPDADRVEAALDERLGVHAGAAAVDASSWMTLGELEAELAAPVLPAAARMAGEATLRYLVGVLLARRGAAPDNRAVTRTRGHRRALTAALRELGMGRPGDLARALRGLGEDDEARRLRDLVALRGELDAELERRGLFDAGLRHRAALRGLREGRELPARLRGRQRVVFRHVLDLGPARLALIRALAERLGAGDGEPAGRVTIRLPRVPLGRFLEPAVARLEGWAREGLPLEVAWDEAQERGPTAEVVVASAPGAEARAVIEEARRWRDAGPVTIAVSGAGAAEGEWVRGLAREARVRGAELHMRRGAGAAESSSGRLLRLVHELLDEDLPREGLARLLFSIGMTRAEGVPPAHRIASMLRHGMAERDRPAGALARGLSELADRIERSRERHPFRVDELRRAARRVAWLVEALRSLEGTHDAAGWALRHRELLVALREEAAGTPMPAVFDDWPAAIPAGARRVDDETAGSEARAEWEVLAVVDALPELVAGDRDPLPRRALVEVLRDALETTQLRVMGARRVRVRLVTLRELPGLKVGRLLVPGAVEGRLPAPFAPDPVLPDGLRRRVNRVLGEPLLRPRDELDGADREPVAPLAWESELLLSVALMQAAHGALFFRHAAGDKGAPASRAPLVDRLRGVGQVSGDERELPPDPLGPAAPEQRALARAVLEGASPGAGRPDDPRPRDLGARLAMEDARFRFFAAGDQPAGRFTGAAPGAGGLHGAERVLGVGAIETYLRCPFQYFGRRVLGIDEEQEGEPEISAAETGIYLHALAEAVYRRLRDEGRLPLDPAGLAAAAGMVDEVEAELERDWREAHGTGHDALWAGIRADARRRMKGVLERDAEELGARGCRPIELEAEFGFDSGPGAWPALAVEHPQGDVLLRGRIDRIDRAPPGEEPELVIVDYKSGASTTQNRRLKEDRLFRPDLQLPAYLAAAATRFGAGGGIDALYRSFAGGKTRMLSELLEKHGVEGREVGDVIDTALPGADAEIAGVPREAPRNLGHAVRAAVGGMRLGQFPIRSLDCDRCPLAALCRVVDLALESRSAT